ncbi:unnamed protein product [Sphenostylis stenocarpa]|uniref:Phosphoglycerate mutase-like protein 1 n=1 Tax=Sphenostylis stenocarpa TaxID=92480 RepID=A0AA86VJQ2_9FABA|nr:unnamed protein product [Sphenostylis stenocarpa]
MNLCTVGVNCSISTLKPSFPSSSCFPRAFPLLSPPSSLCFSGLSETMDCGGGGDPYVFTLHRCKTIHLVRHGQGIHNVEGDKNYDAYMKSEYFDAHITPLGWQEVNNLRKHVHDSGIMKRIDLVIVSPLLRTLQTAVGVFGGEGYTDSTDALPLMVENAGNSSCAAISSLNCPSIVAVELCRERLIESNEDTWWKTDVRETQEELAARGLKFMNWLGSRKEKEIAIVTHRAFLFHTLSAFGNYSHLLEKEKLSKPYSSFFNSGGNNRLVILCSFANCELRSVVIVDHQVTFRMDLSASDVAHENAEKWFCRNFHRDSANAE